MEIIDKFLAYARPAPKEDKHCYYSVPKGFIPLKTIKKMVNKEFDPDVFKTRFVVEWSNPKDYYLNEVEFTYHKDIHILVVALEFDHRLYYKRLDIGTLFNMPDIITRYGEKLTYAGVKYEGALKEDVLEFIDGLRSILFNELGRVPVKTRDEEKREERVYKNGEIYDGFGHYIGSYGEIERF